MKSSTFLLFLLALGVSLSVGADQPSKKPANRTKPAADDKTRAKASAAKSNDADDAATDEDGKSAKKPAKPSGSLKLSPAGARPDKKQPDEKEVVKNLSYMQGFSLGKQIAGFEELGIKIDMDVLLEAMQAAVSGKEPTMSEEEMQSASNEIQQLLQDRFAAKSKRDAAKNKREGEAFLAENKNKKGVKTLPSGLQYKVLESKSGKGESPKKTDTVQAHYQGTLLNDQVFDSSYRRGQPASFPVNGVIAGWTEALQLMKVGDKWQLFIPADLAYKDAGFHDPQGREIVPPNATLVFEVELLGIQKGSKLPSLK